MVRSLTQPVRRGGLDEADHDAIDALVEAGVASAAAIARKLDRHPSTVAWYMYRAGLMKRSVWSERPRKPYMRGGVLVRPFGAAEDALLLDRRAAGDDLPAIAAAIEARFGHPRGVHSLHVRLTLLASYEAAAEDAESPAEQAAA